MNRKKNKPGRKLNSGKYDTRLPGVSSNETTLNILKEIAELKSASLASAIREILEQEAPRYLEQIKQFKNM